MKIQIGSDDQELEAVYAALSGIGVHASGRKRPGEGWVVEVGDEHDEALVRATVETAADEYQTLRFKEKYDKMMRVRPWDESP